MVVEGRFFKFLVMYMFFIPCNTVLKHTVCLLQAWSDGGVKICKAMWMLFEMSRMSIVICVVLKKRSEKI